MPSAILPIVPGRIMMQAMSRGWNLWCVAVFSLLTAQVYGLMDFDAGLAEARLSQLRQTSDRVRPVRIVHTTADGVVNGDGLVTPNGSPTVLTCLTADHPAQLVLDLGEASLSGYAVIKTQFAKGSPDPVIRLTYSNFPDADMVFPDGDFNEQTRAGYMTRDVELPVAPANINRFEDYTVHGSATLVAPLHQGQFRYVGVSLATPGTSVAIAELSWAVDDFYDRQDLAGYFKSSDPRLDRLWQIGVWTAQLATLRDVNAWRTVEGRLLPRKLEKGKDIGLCRESVMPETGRLETMFELRKNPARVASIGFSLLANNEAEGLLLSLDATGRIQWIRRKNGKDDILRETVVDGLSLMDCRPYCLAIDWKPSDEWVYAAKAILFTLTIDGRFLCDFHYYVSAPGDRFGFWTPKGCWPVLDSVRLLDDSGSELFVDEFEEKDLSAWTFTRADPIVADGAKRDRLVWSGDLWWAGRNLYVSLANQYGMRNSLRLLARAQTPEGYIHACPYAETSNVASGDLGMFESDEFAAWFVPVLHDYWMHTGDASLVAELWPNLVKLMDYLDSATDQIGLYKPRYETSKHAFASYLQSGDMAHRSYMDILLWACCKEASQMAFDYGDNVHANQWLLAAERKRNAIEAVYWDAAKGCYRAQKEDLVWAWDNKLLKMVAKPGDANDMMANALALALGFVSPQRGRSVAARVGDNKDVIKFVLLGAIGKADYGMGDEAWRMIATNSWSSLLATDWDGPACVTEGMNTKADVRKWGKVAYWLDQSHPDVALAGFITRSFLGVVPLEPGYKTFGIDPKPYEELEWAEGIVPTPYGPIKVKWWREDGELKKEIISPPGTVYADAK